MLGGVSGPCILHLRMTKTSARVLDTVGRVPAFPAQLARFDIMNMRQSILLILYVIIDSTPMVGMGTVLMSTAFDYHLEIVIRLVLRMVRKYRLIIGYALGLFISPFQSSWHCYNHQWRRKRNHHFSPNYYRRQRFWIGRQIQDSQVSILLSLSEFQTELL
jgi:hypothetical protein